MNDSINIKNQRLKSKNILPTKTIKIIGIITSAISLIIGIATITLAIIGYKYIYINYTIGPWKTLGPLQIGCIIYLLFISLIGIFIFLLFSRMKLLVITVNKYIII